MNESVYYEPPADVQKTEMEDAASRPRFRTFSAGALNFHSISSGIRPYKKKSIKKLFIFRMICSCFFIFLL